MSVEIPEVPGSFRRFISHIEPRNITEFSYRYGDTQRACVYASFQAADTMDAGKVMQALRDDGCSVLELTGNELAKAHVRHLVGGRALQGTDELLFRFEFPERPGALTKFLTHSTVAGTLALPLPQPWRRHRPRARRLAGAARGAAAAAERLDRRVCLLPRDGQCRVQAVSAMIRTGRGVLGGPQMACILHRGGAIIKKIPIFLILMTRHCQHRTNVRGRRHVLPGVLEQGRLLH